MPRHVAENVPMSPQTRLITPKIVVDELETPEGEVSKLYAVFRNAQKLQFKVNCLYQVQFKKRDFLYEPYENLDDVDLTRSFDYYYNGFGVGVAEGKTLAIVVSVACKTKFVPEEAVFWMYAEPRAGTIKFSISRDDGATWTELPLQGELYAIGGAPEKMVRTRIELTPDAMIFSWIVGWRR